MAGMVAEPPITSESAPPVNTTSESAGSMDEEDGAAAAGDTASSSTNTDEKKLEQVLRLLAQDSDEHVVAGLLVLSKLPTTSLTDDVAVTVSKHLVKTRFLERLLNNKHDDEEDEAKGGSLLTAEQRAACAVTTQLARASLSAAKALAPVGLPPLFATLSRAADRGTLRARGGTIEVDSSEDEDLEMALECVATLVECLREDPYNVRRILAMNAETMANPSTALIGLECSPMMSDEQEEPAWRLLAHDLLGLSLEMFGPATAEDVAVMVRAASRARCEKRLSLELKILESLTVALEHSGLRRKAKGSSVAGVALRSSESALIDAATRHLLLGSGDERYRDGALRLAAGACRLFGVQSVMGGERTGFALRVITQAAAAEARLSLDEAIVLCAEKGNDAERLQRCLLLAPVCLGLLEAVIDALLGDEAPETKPHDDDSDSDDNKHGEDSDDELATSDEISSLAAQLKPETLLEFRQALADAADASLGFLAEARQLQEALKLPDLPPDVAHNADIGAALSLSKDCLRFLGRLALDEQDDDSDNEEEDEEDDGGDDDPKEPDHLSLHKRLKEFRPFVNELIAADQLQQQQQPDQP